MTNRRIIIGDIHGHYDALMSLMKIVAPSSEDQVYFLGDLIDRGPNSAQVVEFVIRNNYPCLRGNHEEMLLDTLDTEEIDPELYKSWLYNGGYSTITSYNNNIPTEHIEWMRNLPSYLDLGDIWLVHAGVNPNMSIQEQTSEQFCWIREEFHSMSEPYFADKLIVTGHTITFTLPGVKPGKIAAGPGWLGIETGVYHSKSGWLTALDVDQSRVYQVDSTGSRPRTMALDKAITRIDPKAIGSKRTRGWFFLGN
jgi:serine/threonine protein phosphatase 1